MFDRMPGQTEFGCGAYKSKQRHMLFSPRLRTRFPYDYLLLQSHRPYLCGDDKSWNGPKLSESSAETRCQS